MLAIPSGKKLLVRSSGDFKGGLRVLEHPPRDCNEILIIDVASIRQNRQSYYSNGVPVVCTLTLICISLPLVRRNGSGWMALAVCFHHDRSLELIAS